MTTEQVNPPRTLIGTCPNHWLYSTPPPVFDLSRPSPPDYAPLNPNSTVLLATSTAPVIVSPLLSALVIIDMQNFFLSEYISRPADGLGNKAGRKLIHSAIPAARKAGMQVIWLKWGLTDDELEKMPPSIRRALGFEATVNEQKSTRHSPNLGAHERKQAATEYFKQDRNGVLKEQGLTENGKPKRIYQGLGSEMGMVQLADGVVVDAGRLLMKNTWNAALPPALDAAYQEGRRQKEKPDIWMHKDRMSGL